MRKLAITVTTIVALLATATAAQADYSVEAVNSDTWELCGTNPINCEIDLDGQTTLQSGSYFTFCEVGGTGYVEGDGSVTIDQPEISGYCYNSPGLDPCDDQSGVLPWQGQIRAVDVPDPGTGIADLEVDLAFCVEGSSQEHLSDQFTFPVGIDNGGASWTDLWSDTPNPGGSGVHDTAQIDIHNLPFVHGF